MEAVLKLREGYPRWGKDKLVVLLHDEEFYEVTESSFDIAELRGEPLEWERTYNTVRPHQVLGYVTPLKFLEEWKECQERRMCH